MSVSPGTGESVDLDVEGHRLRLTNLRKVLWPHTGTTKGDMLAYYRDVSSALLPHLAGRPVTQRRFPEGVHGLSWYQTQCRGRPDWIRTAPVLGRRGAMLHYCVIDGPAALLWVVNLATVELHPFLHEGERPQTPRALMVDLDPGPPAGLVECCRVALRVRALLQERALSSVVKTSGSLGLHVVAPLDGGASYAATRALAREMARTLAAQTPDAVTDRPGLAERSGRVLVDWLQNSAGRSTVAPYSLRALPWPSVSTPLTWDEVEACAAGGDPRALMFLPATVLSRLERHGDLFTAAAG